MNPIYLIYIITLYEKYKYIYRDKLNIVDYHMSNGEIEHNRHV